MPKYTNTTSHFFSLLKSSARSPTGPIARRISRDTATMASTGSLLDLPPELRVRIVGSAIMIEAPIKFTVQLRQPGVAMTSRLRGLESHDIYYTRNDINAVICDCDASLLNRWLKGDFSSGVGRAKLSSPGISLRGKSHWVNLVAWCKSPFESGTWVSLAPVRNYDEASPLGAVIITAHARVDNSLDWDQCERGLKDLWKLVALIDRRCLDEHRNCLHA